VRRPGLIVGTSVLTGAALAAGRSAIDGALAVHGGNHLRVAALGTLATLATLMLADRRRALSIVLPVVGLVVVGDLVAYRVVTVTPGLPTPRVSEGMVTLATLGAFLQVRDARARRVARSWKLIGVTGCVLIALPLVPRLGVTVGGQNGWISLAGLRVTPGEPGRALVVLAFALGLGNASIVPGRFVSAGALRRHLRAPALMLGVAVLLHAAANDFGPIVLLLATGGLVVTLAAGRVRFAAAGVAVAGAAVSVGAMLVPYVHGRIQDVLDPLASDPGGLLSQAAVARMVVAWGGLTGTGLGAGLVGGPGALPAARSDMSLLVFAQETGLAGLLVSILLLGLMLHAGWTRISHAPSGAAQLAAGGLWGLLTVQTLWMVAALTGQLPHAGLTLPLVSGGRSAAATVGAILGLSVAFCSSASRSETRRPAFRAPRVLAATTALALALVMVATTGRVLHERTELNRLPNNPLRAAKAQDQGVVETLSGRFMQDTTGRGSLDALRLRRTGSRSVRAVLDPVADDGGLGLTGAMEAVLRCYGSEQGMPTGPGWSHGATAIAGDPSRCRPAGLATTLDEQLTEAADEALASRPGSIAIVDVETGVVRALAGRAPGAPYAAPWVALRTALPPGSAMKLVTAAAALDAGVGGEQPWRAEHVAADGTTVGGRPCGGSLAAMLAVSCNQGFAALAERAGAARFSATATRLGFDSARRVNGMLTARPTVFAGASPTPGLLATAGIGQGRVLTTALHMASVAQAIGSGGIRHPPSLVAAICTADGAQVERSAPSVGARALPEGHAREIETMMGAVIASGGTAPSLGALGWVAAAKTGTAQLPARADLGSPAGTVGWVVAITAPGVERRRLAVAVNVLPTASQPAPTGGGDAASVLEALGAAVTTHTARPDRRPCSRDPVWSEQQAAVPR
jgi:cell division protein FtsW (lipid II flippase)